MSQDPRCSELFPVQLPVAMSGGGSALLTGLDRVTAGNLWQFLTIGLRAGCPTQSCTPVFAASPSMAVAQGLSLVSANDDLRWYPPQSRSEAGQDPIRVMQLFLQTFCRSFPAAAFTEFPGLFSSTGMMTVDGMMQLQTLIANRFYEEGPVQSRYYAVFSGLRGI